MAALTGCAALFYLAPAPPLYGLALLGLAVLSWYRLDLALILVPLFVPFFMAPKQLESKRLPPSEVFLALDAAIALVQVTAFRASTDVHWERVRRSTFLGPAVLLAGAAAISTVFAADRHAALYAFGQTILEPLLFVSLALLFARGPSTWWYLFGALLASGFLLGLIALVQLATGQDLTHVSNSSLVRVRAVYGSPDNLGLLLDRVLPVWLAVALLAPMGRWSRAALLAAMAVPTLALLMTFSRGAWLGVAAGCLLLLTVHYPWGRWLALGAATLLTLSFLLFQPAVVNALQLGHSNTGARRVDVWRSALDMLRDHPVLGIGPDNFLHYYAPKTGKYLTGCTYGLGYMKPEAWPEPCLSHPHQEFLDFWLSAGLLGLAAFLWLLAVFWRSAVTAWRGMRGHPEQSLVLGSMAAMLAALVHGLIDNLYFLMDLSTLFWLFCAFISVSSSALPRMAESRESPAATGPRHDAAIDSGSR